jgi:hypothetical protein
MMDYENMRKLLQFFDVKDFPRTHWYNSIGWGMASFMHEILKFWPENPDFLL